MRTEARDGVKFRIECKRSSAHVDSSASLTLRIFFGDNPGRFWHARGDENNYW